MHLRAAGKDLERKGVEVRARSEYVGHSARNVLLERVGPALAALPVDPLRGVCGQLDAAGRRLNLWVTLDTHQRTPAVRPHLELCDKRTLWTWRAEDLGALEANLARLEKRVPGKPVVLGCSVWDFGAQKPMPVEAMCRQCDPGLRWLRAGRIEGMIFLGTPICDLDLEAVTWTRRWIAAVGNEPLRVGRRSP